MLRSDVGAGPGNSAYRGRPLVGASGDEHYVNERTVGVQQTAWAYVAQSRAWLPAPIRALFWFAPDDSATAVRIPLYGGATRIPPSFGDPIGQEPAAAVAYGVEADAYTMSMDSAFCVWNLVANLAYGERYDVVMPLVQQKIREYQDRFFEQTAKIDKQAEELLRKDPKSHEAIELISRFGVETGEKMTKDWRNFWMYLFARVRDGFTVLPPKKKQCAGKQRADCTSRAVPQALESGYSQAWYERIVSDGENKEHYHVPKAHAYGGTYEANLRQARIMDKVHESKTPSHQEEKMVV